MKRFEWIGQNKKAIAPLRVSSSGQEGNTSWITQKRDCEEYCRQNDLELVEVIEIVESASKSEQRREFKKILDKALKQKIQHILFHCYDRESRNLTDNENNENLVRQGKVVIHYIKDHKVLYKGSPDSDFLMRDFYAVQNKHYSRDLSSKVKRAASSKAEQGWFPGCRPPDGYIQEKLKSEKGFEKRRGAIVVPDPQSQVVKRVQREFEMRAEIPTPPYKEIRKRIIQEGLIPSDRTKHYHSGGIQRRLENIFYDQRFMWNGVEYRGNHDRIISPELFWKVQETFGKTNPYKKNPDALFGNGWIKCADPVCGCSVVYDPKTKILSGTGEKKLYKYYRCSNGRRVHTGSVQRNVSEKSLLDQLSGAVKKISIQDDFKAQLLNAVNETYDKVSRAAKEDLEKYKAAQDALSIKDNKAFDLYSSGEIDRDTYNLQRLRVQKERQEFTKLMMQAQTAISSVGKETVESIIELATNAESLWKHMTDLEKRELLDKLLSNRALDGVTVRYEIIKPLRTLSKMKEDEDWRREWDSFWNFKWAHHKCP